MRRILLALGILVFMTGSAYGFDLEKVCGDFAALRSPETKVYRGTLQRTYPSTRSSQETGLVVIETTEKNTVLLFYLIEGFSSRRHRCYPMLGRIAGKTLDVRSPWRAVTQQYTFDGHDRLTGKYAVKNRSGKVTREFEMKLQLDK